MGIHVRHPNTNSPKTCTDLGAAIGAPHAPEQQHVGLLYKNENDNIRFLHLAWHFKLMDEDAPESGYVWVESGLDPVSQMTISQYCQLIAEKNKSSGIPYGLRYPGDLVFDSTSGAWTGPPGHGLTCASFILALYKAIGFDLINMKEWPQRDEDQVWGRNILDMLRGRASSEHIRAQEDNLEKGLVRFRPGEVVGAVASPSPPVGFDLAALLADQILAELCEYLAAGISVQSDSSDGVEIEQVETQEGSG